MTEVSASAGAKKGVYSCFGPPLSSDSFIPSVHARGVKDRAEAMLADAGGPTPEVRSIMQALRDEARAPTFLHPRPSRPEELYTEPVLRAAMNSVTSCATDLLRARNVECTLVCADGAEVREMMAFKLASSTSTPEPCVVVRAVKAVVAVSEAKGADAAMLQAYPQCMQIGGDAALSLYDRGLDLEHCVVPGIVCAGECMRVVAIGLLPGPFPFMMAVSPIVSYVDLDGLRRLSTYASLVLFCPAPVRGLVALMPALIEVTKSMLSTFTGENACALAEID